MSKKCKLGEHTDRRMKGGHTIECTGCSDVFPCRHECGHADCIIATGRELPEWIVINPDDVEAILAGVLPEGMDVKTFLAGNAATEPVVTKAPMKYLKNLNLSRDEL